MSTTFKRWWKHLSMTRWHMRAAFPKEGLQTITAAVRASEHLHGGEIRVALEADLSLEGLWRGQTSRARALEVFASLGVWDTRERNGVLIYLCLADRAVEIVADRGLHAAVSDEQWAEVSKQLQRDCAAHCYLPGMSTAIESVGRLIGTRYPTADANEQPDQPVLL